MAKLTLTDIDTIDASSIIEAMSDNNTAIETAMENTLSRDGTSPNSMEADLDMDSNRILNLPLPVSETEPARLKELNDIVLGQLEISVTLEDDSVTFAKMQNIDSDKLIGRDAVGSGDPTSISVGGGIEFDGANSLRLADLGVSTAKIANDGVTYAKIQNVTENRLLGRSSGVGAGDVTEIPPTGGIELSSGNLQTTAFTGDVTKAAGGTALTIANDAVTYAKLQNESASTLLGRSAGTPGDVGEVTLGGGLNFTGGGGIETSAFTGDVTKASGGTVTTIADDVVTNAKMADMNASTIKGRAAGAGTGDPTDLTAAQATAVLNNFVGDSGAGGTKGLVPAPAAGDAAANKFLMADGVWTVPAGGGTLTRAAATNDNAIARWDGPSANVLQNSGVTIDDSANLSSTGNIVTTASFNGALAVGNVSNPAFWVDSSVGSQNNGWKVVGNTGTSASALRVIGSSADIPGTIDSSGSGSLTFNNTATGNIVLARNTTCSSDLTVTGNATFNGNTTLGNAAGDTVVMNAESITRPNSPTFLAYNSATDADVTGDGTAYTIICDTEVFDVGGDYNNATGVYTSAVTAKHLFAGLIAISGLSVGVNTLTLQLVTSNRTYDVLALTAPSAIYCFSWCAIADMDVTDTAFLRLTVSGGSKTVDVAGNASTVQTSFSSTILG